MHFKTANSSPYTDFKNDYEWRHVWSKNRREKTPVFFYFVTMFPVKRLEVLLQHCIEFNYELQSY
jgi:hypothetical protein